MQTVSATELARNTREILDAVFSRGETVAVERNHVLIARIVPPQPMMTAAQALEGFRSVLTREEGDAWYKDSREAFDDTVRNPWA